jgi:hypothetical protein
MKKLMILFAVFLMQLPVKSVKAEGTEPDTDSCGLGWQVTKKKTLSGTTTRGTTNMFVPPSFGMTTGTIGCSKHSIAKKDGEAFRYAMVNYDALTVEMAKGKGENLYAFARTLGCSDAGQTAFAKMAQSKFTTIIDSQNTSALDMFTNVKREMQADSVVALTCGNSV